MKKNLVTTGLQETFDKDSLNILLERGVIIQKLTPNFIKIQKFTIIIGITIQS